MEGGGDSTTQNHHQPLQFSPILMGLIGIFAGAAMFATYQCIVKICKNRSGPVLNPIAFEREQEARRREMSRPNSRSSVVHVLQVIMPVFKYNDNIKECVKDETCAVCLCEFSEGEDVRTLPQCMHSFHAPCVDMWLFSHSTCPLCRADTSLPASSRRQQRPGHVVVSMPSSDEVLPLPEVQGSPEIGV